MREAARPIAVLTDLADELSVGVEDLDAIVHGVGHIDVVVFVERNKARQGEVARRGQLMFLAAGTDAALLFQGVGVVDHHLVGLRVHNIELAIFRVDSDSDRIDQAILDLSTTLLFLSKIEHAVQFAVGHEQPIVIIEGDAVDQSKVASWPLPISVVSLVSVLKTKIAPTF